MFVLVKKYMCITWAGYKMMSGNWPFVLGFGKTRENGEESGELEGST